MADRTTTKHALDLEHSTGFQFPKGAVIDAIVSEDKKIFVLVEHDVDVSGPYELFSITAIKAHETAPIGGTFICGFDIGRGEHWKFYRQPVQDFRTSAPIKWGEN